VSISSPNRVSSAASLIPTRFYVRIGILIRAFIKWSS
jgi:hypothetical protein